MSMRIKAWAIDKLKRIVCKDCQTCAELERIAQENRRAFEQWMHTAHQAQDRCVQLQNVIERLCQGYDAMAMAVEGMRHGKE